MSASLEPLAAHPDPVARYSGIAMILHWVVAALMVIGVAAGLAAANADDANVRRLVDFHKSIGLTVLGLVILRILWRLSHKPPPLPRAYPKFEKLGAHAAHIALYAVMLLLPLTGYIHDSAWLGAATHPIVLFGLVPFPRIGFIETLGLATKDTVHSVFSAVHTYLGYVLYGLVALHIGGALKHQLFDRERELQRMLPSGYQRPQDDEAL